MAPTRWAHTGTRVLRYGLLCLVVTMSMLGTPATPWSTDIDSDPPSSSWIEELPLLPAQMTIIPMENGHSHFDDRLSSSNTFFPPAVRILFHHLSDYGMPVHHPVRNPHACLMHRSVVQHMP